MPDDKRTRSRVDAALDAVITLSGGNERYAVRTRNVSLKGMLCDAALCLEGQRECVVTFRLNDVVSFSIEAHIVRCDTQGMAVDFDGMDETAFLHLRSLVRFHAEDPDAIDRELAVPAFKPNT